MSRGSRLDLPPSRGRDSSRMDVEDHGVESVHLGVRYMVQIIHDIFRTVEQRVQDITTVIDSILQVHTVDRVIAVDASPPHGMGSNTR